MGSITRGLSNNITTGGVILPAGITNASVSAVTSFSGVTGGGTLILLSTQTASNSATISFTTGLDSTYDEYIFKFINIHPRTDATSLTFQGSINGGSSYGIAITSTFFATYHDEADTEAGLSYETDSDLAQSTSFQPISKINNLSSDADHGLGGSITLFNPSSTVYVKHFISRVSITMNSDYARESNLAGYFNTTSAVNAIQFKMASGNFDGDIKLYGVKKS